MAEGCRWSWWSPGRAGDSAPLPVLLDALRIARQGPGRPGPTPDALRAEKAILRGKNRAMLQARGITVVIPEKSDAIARRKAKGALRSHLCVTPKSR